MAAVGEVLEADRLLVGYAGTPVCGEVSFSVAAGEVLAVVGFNGAGKSTVVRTLAGRQDPLAGDVRVHRLPVALDAVMFRRQVAAVFDEDVFFPSLTVREHLLLVARGHSLDDPENAVEAELEFFGIADRAHVVPDALSSGQRRRLLLAAGFIRPSSLVFLDEPEQRLDPVMRDALSGRILERAGAGTAIVLVTHDPRLLVRTATSCLVIDEVVTTVDTERGAQIIAGT
ncbi:ABC transporter ATP-binding protein [Arthrobacter agilis]|uniref:ABC transporter ATP-binding protein n=1 Tax=Arthrobacter agilis TaxID=37921 RepID=UPI0027827754|nr:ABC transporter ATP-binding protein [Arthrobacter agilis]MDQ0734983.1 ABC-2 type transport system ATP-binding protein [Arthrobacter agilis]